MAGFGWIRVETDAPGPPAKFKVNRALLLVGFVRKGPQKQMSYSNIFPQETECQNFQSEKESPWPCRSCSAKIKLFSTFNGERKNMDFFLTKHSF